MADRVKETQRAELHKTIWRIANDLRGSVDGDADHFVKVVPNSEIAERDYLISVSSYVEAKDTREEINITELNAEIARIVARQSELRTSIDAIVADLERR